VGIGDFFAAAEFVYDIFEEPVYEFGNQFAGGEFFLFAEVD
jgi:hypothetical protein